MNKKCKVLMLAQDKKGWNKGDLIKITNGQLITIACTNIIGDRDDLQAQELYFVSDDEIQEGDWVINEYNEHADFITPECFKYDGTKCLLKLYKVLASTDPSLQLPIIPQSFIQEYVNAQGKIDEVELEIYTYSLQERIDLYFKQHPDWAMIGTRAFLDNKNIPKNKLKLTQNNEVIVVPSEERNLVAEEFKLMHPNHPKYVEPSIITDKMVKKAAETYALLNYGNPSHFNFQM